MPPERTKKPFKLVRASTTKKFSNQTLLQPLPTAEAVEDIDVVEIEHFVSSTASPDAPEPMQTSQTTVSTLSACRGPRLISWVWNHGFLIDDCIWECKHCEDDDPQQYKCTCTTHIRNHLSDRHNIIDNTQRGKAVPASTNPDEPQLAPIFNKSAPLHVDTFHKHLVDWLLTDRIAFRQVESPTWRRFIATLRPEAISHVPKSGDTVHSWAMNRFDIARAEIKQHLQDSISKIHISCDMWSSPNGHAFLGIVGHWMDTHHVLHTALIALPRVMGAHTGANIATVLVDVFEKYDICEKLGYMMLDNATNNDTAVESLDTELIWRGIIPVISSEERRLRCFGHILNLVVKALLFSKDETALETSKDKITAWRKLGPLGKLHNIVQAIRSSPQRRDRFHSIQITDQTLKDTTFMLCQDNDTRWNSTYDMIQRALQLREAIDRYIVAAMAESRNSKSKAAERLEADQLHAHDWDELKVLHDMLSP